MAALEYQYGHVERLIEEMISSDLQIFRKLFLKDRVIENLIVVGDYMGELAESSSVSKERIPGYL